MQLTEIQLNTLETLAKKYIHWQTPQQSSLNIQNSLAYIMTSAIMINEDVDALIEVMGADVLVDVLRNAKIGQFTHWNVKPNDKPWIFWHTKLNIPITELTTDRFKP